jgi:hypothetical protein
MSIWQVLTLAILASMALTTIYLLFFQQKMKMKLKRREKVQSVKGALLGEWSEQFSCILASLGDIDTHREFSTMSAFDLAQLSRASATGVSALDQWLAANIWHLSQADQTLVSVHMDKARRIEIVLEQGIVALEAGASASPLPDIEKHNRMAFELLLESNLIELSEVKAILSDRLKRIS